MKKGITYKYIYKVRTKELTSIGGPSSFSFKSATSPLSVERES